MIGCVDVHYRGGKAVAALVLFAEWSSSVPQAQHTVRLPIRSEYIPGQFYKRELPCILELLKQSTVRADVILIDGYVWLGVDEFGKALPGLGAHLFDALDKKIPVIGLAKTEYKSANAIKVLRGNSKRPLFVSAVGVDAERSAECVGKMHGDDRIPTMVKLADSLARSGGAC